MPKLATSQRQAARRLFGYSVRTMRSQGRGSTDEGASRLFALQCLRTSSAAGDGSATNDRVGAATDAPSALWRRSTPRDFTFVADVADAYLFASITDLEVGVDHRPAHVRDVSRTSGATDRARELFGWTTVTLDHGLRGQVDWHPRRQET